MPTSKQPSGELSPFGLSPNEQWIMSNENNRALMEGLQFELNQKRREEEAATSVMDLVSGYGTPGQRAEQLYAPRPQLAQALQQFGGNELGAPEAGSNVPSFSDFGSPGQAFAKTSSGGNIDLGMKGLSRTDPSTLSDLDMDILRKSYGLGPKDRSLEIATMQQQSKELHEKNLLQKAIDADIAKVKAAEIAEERKKNATEVAEHRDTLRIASGLYRSAISDREKAYRLQLGTLLDNEGKAIGPTATANAKAATVQFKKEYAESKSQIETHAQAVRRADKEYKAFKEGSVPEDEIKKVDLVSLRKKVAAMGPTYSDAVAAYNMDLAELDQEAKARNIPLEQLLKAIVLKLRKGVDLENRPK